MPGKHILTEEGWLKIGREYSEKGATVLGKELGVTKQRVAQVAHTLRKNGVPIPRLRDKNGIVKKVADILKKEYHGKIQRPAN